MADIGKITIAVDSSQIAEATAALSDLAAAIERVQTVLAKPICITLGGAVIGTNEGRRFTEDEVAKVWSIDPNAQA